MLAIIIVVAAVSIELELSNLIVGTSNIELVYIIHALCNMLLIFTIHTVFEICPEENYTLTSAVQTYYARCSVNATANIVAIEICVNSSSCKRIELDTCKYFSTINAWIERINNRNVYIYIRNANNTNNNTRVRCIAESISAGGNITNVADEVVLLSVQLEEQGMLMHVQITSPAWNSLHACSHASFSMYNYALACMYNVYLFFQRYHYYKLAYYHWIG